MPRERFHKLPFETRETLLRLATRQFAARGFEGASLNEILAEAGLSKGSYYYYFDDKEDLFATVIETTSEKIFAQLVLPDFGDVTRDDYWERVGAFVGCWAKVTDEPLELMQMSLQITDAMRQSPRLKCWFDRMRGIFRVLIVEGQRVGCVRTDLPIDMLVELVEATDGALDRVLAAHTKTMTRADITEHTKLMFDTFRRLLEERG